MVDTLVYSNSFIELDSNEYEELNGGGWVACLVAGVIVCFIWETGNELSKYYTNHDLGYWSGKAISGTWNYLKSIIGKYL